MRLCALGLFLDVQLVDPLLSLRLQGASAWSRAFPTSVNETSTFSLFQEETEVLSRGRLARSPGAGHAGKGRPAFIVQGTHSRPFHGMSRLDPGEKWSDKAVSLLALLWIRGMDDQRRDLVPLALDAEVTQFEMGMLPDQVVEDSPYARIRGTFLFDAGRGKEQSRRRVSIGTIDGVLIGTKMENEALRICLHHLTSFQA
jgi:hypothetical protein